MADYGGQENKQNHHHNYASLRIANAQNAVSRERIDFVGKLNNILL